MAGPSFDLEDLMRRDVQPWMPAKEKDHPRGITGTVIKVTTTPSDYSELPVPVLELVPDDNDSVIWRIVGYHSVLAREIAEQRPVQGDKIGIRYEGSKEGARGPYERYRVAVERAPTPVQPIDWDSIEAAAAAEIGEEPFDPDPEEGSS